MNRQERQLRRVPVWFFSSGPLDDCAERGTIPPTREVRALMDRVGAQGHVTFGGQLAPDARGFPASAMAKRTTPSTGVDPKASRRGASSYRARCPPPDQELRSRPAADRQRGSCFMGSRVGRRRPRDGRSSGSGIAENGLDPPCLGGSGHFHDRGTPLLPSLRRSRPIADRAHVPDDRDHARSRDDRGAPPAQPRDVREHCGLSWLPFALVFCTTWLTGEVMSMMPGHQSPRRSGRPPSASTVS